MKKTSNRFWAILLSAVVLLCVGAGVYLYTRPAPVVGPVAVIYLNKEVYKTIDLGAVEEGYTFTVTGAYGLTNDIEVVPGVTAACSGAALLGAPLSHDFAVISLSDRLTPWETIEKRLTHAAKADLTIALYNPASRSRPAHLKRACDILLRDLPDSRLCGIARNIGRAGESWRTLTLGELREAEVDMFCTVIVGNVSTKEIAGRLITPRGYKNV